MKELETRRNAQFSGVDTTLKVKSRIRLLVGVPCAPPFLDPSDRTKEFSTRCGGAIATKSKEEDILQPPQRDLKRHYEFLSLVVNTRDIKSDVIVSHTGEIIHLSLAGVSIGDNTLPSWPGADQFALNA